MKKLISLSVLLGILLSSCSKESDPLPDLVPQGTWQLVLTHGQVPDSERTGARMEFQETYQLLEDGTFVKKREQDGVITQVNGTYILDEEGYSSGGDPAVWFIKMIYEEGNNLIASCTSSQLEEDLYFTRDHRLVSTHQQCDGLGLEYIKINH